MRHFRDGDTESGARGARAHAYRPPHAQCGGGPSKGLEGSPPLDKGNAAIAFRFIELSCARRHSRLPAKGAWYDNQRTCLFNKVDEGRTAGPTDPVTPEGTG